MKEGLVYLCVIKIKDATFKNRFRKTGDTGIQ
jgi:hypothetical protein